MATQGKESHNSGVRASGNSSHLRTNSSDRELKAAAFRLMKSLGLVPSFRNLYIIQLAIETERELLGSCLQEATDRIIFWAKGARETGETINYFWFEDTGWRYPKLSFRERDDLRERRGY